MKAKKKEMGQYTGKRMEKWVRKMYTMLYIPNDISSKQPVSFQLVLIFFFPHKTDLPFRPHK